RTGAEHWRRRLPGEVITAPVLAEGHVYLATLEGTLSCFRQADGEPVWNEPKNATSSPVVWNGQCYFSRRHEVPLAAAGKQMPYASETMSARGSDALGESRDYSTTHSKADWLDYAKREQHSPVEMTLQMHDTHVGFGFAKGDAKMEQARRNLGHGTVAGVWAYQGSKPFVHRDRLYSAQGDVVQCAHPFTDELF